jgi:DNA-binding transcriptional regulator WhiA
VTGNFGTANAHRALAAWAADHDVAERALAGWQPGWPEAWAEIAQARLDYPGWQWAELAAQLGITKNQATARFRRLREAVNSR